MNNEIISKLEVRIEKIGEHEGKPTLMKTFYNEDGNYIGTLSNFKVLVEEKEILPETFADNEVCSIGKSLKDGKWYGWSHRAIFGFQIGDTVKEGDCCASSGWTKEYLKYHPDPYVLPVGFTAKTEDDAKKMAIAFSNSVS